MTDRKIYEAMAMLNTQNRGEKALFEFFQACLKLCENDRVRALSYLREWLEQI